MKARHAPERVIAVVPVKSLAAAKTRLRGTLVAAERRGLMLWMAERVVRSLRSSGRIAHIAVVTPDPEVVSWAREQGAIPLWQPHEGLNRGLELARAWVVGRRADALLVTLGDLPTLAAHEVRALLAYGPGATSARAVVLAPDRDERGTNLLLMRPPALLPFSFGAESFVRHMAISRAIAGEPLVFHAPGTAFDVDTPDDLAEVEARGLWRRSPNPQEGTPSPQWAGSSPQWGTPPADTLAPTMGEAAHG